MINSEMMSLIGVCYHGANIMTEQNGLNMQGATQVFKEYINETLDDPEDSARLSANEINLLRKWLTQDPETLVGLGHMVYNRFRIEEKIYCENPLSPLDQNMKLFLDNNEQKIKDIIYAGPPIKNSQEFISLLKKWGGASGMQKTINKGGCYIATSVYGSYDCPQVWTLRRFRDSALSNSWYGKAFIKLYYAISPSLVRLFGNSKCVKKMWLIYLDKLVINLHKKGFTDAPYDDK